MYEITKSGWSHLVDEWRPEIWDIIHLRHDCSFFSSQSELTVWMNVFRQTGETVTTMSPSDARLKTKTGPTTVCLISFFVNQTSVGNRCPMIEQIDLSSYLNSELIDEVSVGGEQGKYARPLDFDWVLSLRQ